MIIIVGLPKLFRQLFNLVVKETPYRTELLRRFFWFNMKSFLSIDVEYVPLFRGKQHIYLYNADINVHAVRYDLNNAYPTLLLHILEHGIPIDGEHCDFFGKDRIKVYCSPDLVKLIKSILEYRKNKDRYVIAIVGKAGHDISQFAIAVKHGEKMYHYQQFISEAYSQDPFTADEVVEYAKKIKYTVYIFRLSDFVKYGILTLIGYFARKSYLSPIHYAIIDMCYDVIEYTVNKLIERGSTVYYTYVDCVCYDNTTSISSILPAKIEAEYEQSKILFPPLFCVKPKYGLWLVGTEDTYYQDPRIRVWNYAVKIGRMPSKSVVLQLMYPSAINFIQTLKLRYLPKMSNTLIQFLNKLSIYGYRYKLKDNTIVQVKFSGKLDWYKVKPSSQKIKYAWLPKSWKQGTDNF